MHLHFYSTFDNLRKLSEGEEVILRTKSGARAGDNIHVSLSTNEYAIRDIPGDGNSFIACKREDNWRPSYS